MNPPRKQPPDKFAALSTKPPSPLEAPRAEVNRRMGKRHVRGLGEGADANGPLVADCRDITGTRGGSRRHATVTVAAGRGQDGRRHLAPPDGHQEHALGSRAVGGGADLTRRTGRCACAADPNPTAGPPYGGEVT
ncbi:hypothetical protein GCM10010254_59220 [Streptomyces chromofuscus]|nr:hypothetical protein GCM10010254_59220 [Streptomyces chromofuscus]